MRRMNYNPLNNVYASGAYNSQLNEFKLDKELESGHLYYARIMSSSLESQTCCLIDTFKNTYGIKTSPFTFLNNQGFYDAFTGSIVGDSLTIDKDVNTPTSDEDYIAYIYQLI